MLETDKYELHVIGQLALAAFHMHGYHVSLPQKPGEMWAVKSIETGVTSFGPNLADALKQHDPSL